MGPINIFVFCSKLLFCFHGNSSFDPKLTCVNQRSALLMLGEVEGYWEKLNEKLEELTDEGAV